MLTTLAFARQKLFQSNPISPSMGASCTTGFATRNLPNYVTEVSHGVNMPRLGTEAGRAAPFVLAPLPEQKRIADKLDSVLARVDACRDRLDRLPALLKRFRRSILDAGTSDTDKDWRNRPEEQHYRQPNTGKLAICKIKDAGKIQLGRQRSARNIHSGEKYAAISEGVQNVFEDRLRPIGLVMSMDFPG